jgi:hypothetical protein
LGTDSDFSFDRFGMEINQISELRLFVKQCGGIESAAFRLNVKPLTLLKVLKGNQMSLYIGKKVFSNLQDWKRSSQFSDDKAARIKRFHRAYLLYQQKGTLAAVGREMGISREAVRQILARGNNLGLFEYKPRRKNYQPLIPKEKILDDYKKYLNLKKVAKENNISIHYFEKLLVENNITKETLDSVKKTEKKLKCINEYKEIVEELGHHPTTTELHRRSKSWLSLFARVFCLWGSFTAFRKELNVPEFHRGNPWIKEHTRKWQEYERKNAIKNRNHQLEQIRIYLKKSGSNTFQQIVFNLGINRFRTGHLMRLLVADGEVVKEKKRKTMEYRLAKN